MRRSYRDGGIHGERLEAPDEHAPLPTALPTARFVVRELRGIANHTMRVEGFSVQVLDTAYGYALIAEFASEQHRIAPFARESVLRRRGAELAAKLNEKYLP